MNAVKTLALVASSIGLASISLPAYSQQVDSNQAAQIAIVTGNNGSPSYMVISFAYLNNWSEAEII